jgi:hypothetical protein
MASMQRSILARRLAIRRLSIESLISQRKISTIFRFVCPLLQQFLSDMLQLFEI